MDTRNNSVVTNGQNGDAKMVYTRNENFNDFDLIEVMEYDFGSRSETNEEERSDPMLSIVTKRGLIKSILGCCLAVFLFFGAYSSTFALQSSLHLEGGLGTISLSVLYAVSLLSYPWLPSLTIRVLGLKKTMIVCVTFGSLFVVANFYPTWTSILVSCAICGVAMSTLWTCIPAYLTRCTLLYCRLNEQIRSGNQRTNYSQYFAVDTAAKKQTYKNLEERLTSRVFAFFYFCFQSSMLTGHISAYAVLNYNPDDDLITRDDNYNQTNYTVSLYCGANYCDSNDVTMKKPEDWRVFSLCGLYIASFIGAFFAIVLIMEPLYYKDKDLHISQEIAEKRNYNQFEQFLKFAQNEVMFSLKSTCGFLKSKKLLPLAIITLYQGLENAFVSGEFTKAFVSCTCGVDCVNYVLICYSVTYIIGSITWSWMLKITGRVFVILGAFALIIFNLLLLLFWEPSIQEPPITLFCMAAIFGLADCAMQPQIMALYSLTFRDKEADIFAAVGCADCLGGLLGFTFSTLFCLRTKIYIVVIVWSCAVIGYIVSEVVLRVNQPKN